VRVRPAKKIPASPVKNSLPFKPFHNIIPQILLRKFFFACNLIGKDEGRGFQKKSNSNFFLNAMTLFWETHLLGNGESSD